MPITVKKVRDAEWLLVYHYVGTISFKTYSSGIPGLTITHERTKDKAKVRILYSSFGRKTDSISQAVKFWNDNERKAIGATC